MKDSKLKNVTKEELKKLILDEKLSYEEIGRRYDVSGTAIKKKAKRLGIDIPKKRKINSKETFNKGCSKKEKSVCENCGKEFISSNNSKGRFCSRYCYMEYQKKSSGESSEEYKDISFGKKTILKNCHIHGLTEFVKSGPKDDFRCKKCRVDYVTKKRRLNKRKLVEYKGGKCEICGYDRCINALEFHHLDPNEKEFGISNKSIRSFEKLKKKQINVF